MNFLYRNRSAAKVPKTDHWEYQQNVLDAKMGQCRQNILDARMAGNHQGLLDSMSELESVVEEQRRRLREVRKLKDEARSRLRQLETLEKGLVEKEGGWPLQGWMREQKEKARVAMMRTMHEVEAEDPLPGGQPEAAAEDTATEMDIDQSL